MDVVCNSLRRVGAFSDVSLSAWRHRSVLGHHELGHWSFDGPVFSTLLQYIISIFSNSHLADMSRRC